VNAVTRSSSSSKPDLTLELLKLAAPIVAVNLAYALLGVIDTLFMGHLGSGAVAAVGLGGVTYYALFLLLRGTANAVTIFVSRSFGAQDLPACGVWLVRFLWLALVLCLFVPVLYFGFNPILNIFNPAPEVLAGSLTFAQIRTLEIPFALISAVLLGFRLGVGDSRTPMFITWGTVLVNVALNYVLVFGEFGLPALGIRGSAIGTACSIVLQTLVVVLIVLAPNERKKYRLHFEFPKLEHLKTMLKIGLPLGATEFVEVGAFAAFSGVIARLGTRELAASQIANQIASLAFMPGFALGIGTGSLVGRFLGAGTPDLARAVGYTGVRVGMIWMGVVGVIFFAFPQWLVGGFNPEPRVLELATSLLRFMAFYQIFDAAGIIFRGALSGASDTRFPMIVTMIGAWVVMVGGAMLLTLNFGWGLIGAWAGAFVYVCAMGVIFWLRWRAGHWQDLHFEPPAPAAH
jgi:multidrug resistance protein, MATE family